MINDALEIINLAVTLKKSDFDLSYTQALRIAQTTYLGMKLADITKELTDIKEKQFG